ncbi:hypothetical protein ACFL08_05625 [Patescibacteria group bacterium]
MARRNSILKDLDNIIAQNEGGGGIGNNFSVELPNDWPEIEIKGTSIALVVMVIDDSKSMRYRRIEEKLLKGLRRINAIFKDAGEKRQVILVVQGFKQRYFAGDVLTLTDEYIDTVECTNMGTPVVTTSYDLAKEVRAAEELLTSKGIQVSVNMLVMTDGESLDDRRDPREFQKVVETCPHWSIMGLGVYKKDEYDEQECPIAVQEFRQLFSGMGIRRISTPDASGLEFELAKFSKSVSGF